MAELAKKYQDQLTRLKECVRASYEDFTGNYERFHAYRNFIFNTSITDDDKAVLIAVKKPQIECNITEAFLSRLCGEYAKQEPSLNVSSADGSQLDPKLVDFLDGHFRWLLYEANKDGFEYNVYSEELSGGFSGMEVRTEYESEKSFNQVIRISKPDEVTMVGYDPLARKPHKGDGRYWFKLYPKTEKEFKDEYPDVKIDEMSFSRAMGGFSWSYTTSKDEKVLLMCELFEKKKKKTKLIKLSNDKVMLESEYDDFINQWNEAIQKGLTVQQPPTIVDSRKTEVTTVCRYIFIESQVLEYDETDFHLLNGVFVDGNSIWLKTGGGSSTKQMTRPYGYHAKGIQRLKNFAMQSLANELENLVQSKWIVPIEGLPSQPEYQEVYSNDQVPNVVMYNAYYDKDTAKPLPAPTPVVRPPIPAEIMSTFVMCDQAMQMILGSYDSALGVNDNQLSGKAIIAGATQSNAAAMPYVVGNLQALNQVGQIVVDLLPKLNKAPRTMPIIDKQGNHKTVMVNKAEDPNSINLDYDSSLLHVRVEAGVNFAVQKQQSLQQIVALSQGEQVFSQFINTMCLDVLVDNLEIRGADLLKERAQKFMAMLQQQQKAQMQQSMQPNPMIQIKQQELGLKQQDLSLRGQQIQGDMVVKTAQVQNDKDSIDNERLDILLKAEQANRKDVVEMAKANAEDKKSAVDLALKTGDHVLKHADQLHRHAKETVELHHQLSQPQQSGENENG